MTTRVRIPPCALVALSILGGLAREARGQTLDDVREDVRALLEAERFPVFIASFVDLAEENELAAANYRIDDGFGTEVGTIKLPYRTVLGSDADDAREEGEHGIDDATRMYLEGNLGYLAAETEIGDMFQGVFPAIATSVDADWTVYSGLVGAGARIPVAGRFALTPLFDLSLAYIESDASYGGPGAALGPVLFDGLLFNWNAWMVTYGPALRADWSAPLGEEILLETVARYDLRRSETLDSTDEAQDGSVTSQRFTLRGDVTGPTRFGIEGRAVRWRGTLAGTWFPGDTGEALGFDSFVEVGGALEVPLPDSVPVVSELALSGALIYGADVTGWTIGVGTSF